MQPFVERAFRALSQRGEALVMVDDLDLGEAVFGRALRMAIHSSEFKAPVVVASASDSQEGAARELGVSEVLDVPALDLGEVRTLVAETLGAVDSTVVRAIHRRASGVPGQLVDLLAELWDQPGPTAADVEHASVGEVGEAVARRTLAASPEEARPALEALATVRAPVPADVLATAMGVELAALEACELSGILLRVPEGVALGSPALAALLMDGLSADESASRAQALIDHHAIESFPLHLKARLAIEARDHGRILQWVPRAAAELTGQGAFAASYELRAAFTDMAKGADGRLNLMEMSRLCHAMGRYDAAEEAAQRIADDTESTADDRAQAAVLAGRACTSAGRFGPAVVWLERVPPEAGLSLRTLALRELSRVLLKKGDYEDAEVAARQGLDHASPDDPVRVELLTSLGMVDSYRGHREDARKKYQEALSLARARSSRRDEANVLTYLAIDHERAGDFRKARDLYQESLEIARDLEDLGSMAVFALNLGSVHHRLGELGKAAELYTSSARMARRSGRTSTDVMARINLTSLHIYLGLYEQARVQADTSLSDANEAGMKPAAAQALALLGDLAARTGDVEMAILRYDEAAARYRRLGQGREVVETTLDSVEALLDRGGPSDSSGAASRLAEARAIMEESGDDEFSLALAYLTARTRGATGDVDGGVESLKQVIEEAREAQNRELEWKALAAASFFNALRGSDFVARRQEQEAMEVLESVATGLPREYRDAFWHDPRRRDVRRRAAGDVSRSGATSKGLSTSSFHGVGLEARAARLLEIIKRLASEHEVDRLLERITDSAVELAGAERGFVLLVGEDGRLSPRTVRDTVAKEADPHIAFSQSIAEAVLIDGEPIITIDARDDSRLSEYMSVHKLMLKSVACLPIRARSGTLGVLYLEHRMRRGRFDEADVDLLLAFGDQAAIALENARLIEENEKRRRELEQANADLESAKAEIERVLAVRTAELEEAKKEVDEAREVLKGAYERHGIVGRSEAMLRVFAVVDRVREASVPVVIHGESGTGKELVARAIHYGGPRAKGPFVALNCAAVPEALLESELFGHVRGAFTGADRDRKGVLSQASGGALFLDEVGDMPPKMQVDLLRVLQDGRVRPVGAEKDEIVDVRIIAASNKLLTDQVAQGKFREDLYYRLNVVELRLPPLRARPDDIPLLCDYFLSRFAKRDGVAPKRISRGALERLAEAHLPGNVRQLEHLLLNAWVMVDRDVIDAEDLALDTMGVGAQASIRPLPVPSGPGNESGAHRAETLDDFKDKERSRILEALESHAWNRAKAAKELGMPRRTFYRRLKEHGII